MLYHESVMVDEVVTMLNVRPGRRYCDATVGGGGHTRRILEVSQPDGKVVAIDQDTDAIAHCQETLHEFGPRLVLKHGNFGELKALLSDGAFLPIDGLVVDLGVSSHQIDTPERGFSFVAEGPLDMRMDQTNPYRAKNLIADLSERDLAQHIWLHGEERLQSPHRPGN